MISRYEYPGGVWVDIEQPTGDEIRDIAKEFSISERLGSELLSPTPNPLVAGDVDTALLVLHFPVPRENDEVKSQEIDFIVGEHFVVTVRYDLVISLHHLKKILETETVVAGHSALSTDVLLEILFAHLYTAVRDHVNHNASLLDLIEREMFSGRERSAVRAISDLSREFLHLEATLVNHEEPLIRFLKTLADHEFFGPSFVERAGRMAAARTHTAHLVHTYRAVTTELRETNKALLETRQNEIVKTLTLITFSVMPLELTVLIFGVHAPGTPLEGNPYAFWIMLGILGGIFGIMVIILARKRWLF